MFTAMVGGPLIVGRLLNLPEETRILMVSGTMIGCGVATMISALGLGFIGPRLPIVMGVFYIFIGPIVAISKEAQPGRGNDRADDRRPGPVRLEPADRQAAPLLPADRHRHHHPADRHRPHEDRHQRGDRPQHAGVRQAADARPRGADDRAHHRHHALINRLRARTLALHHHGGRLSRVGGLRPDRSRHRRARRLGQRAAAVSRSAGWRGRA